MKRFVAYFKHHKAQCGRHHYHGDFNLKLVEEHSYFDSEVGKISSQHLTLIIHAIFLTDSFFSLLQFEYSVIVAYLIDVRGCVEIVPVVCRVVLKILLKRTNRFSQTYIADEGFVGHCLIFFQKEMSLNLQSECKT